MACEWGWEECGAWRVSGGGAWCVSEVGGVWGTVCEWGWEGCGARCVSGGGRSVGQVVFKEIWYVCVCTYVHM